MRSIAPRNTLETTRVIPVRTMGRHAHRHLRMRGSKNRGRRASEQDEALAVQPPHRRVWSKESVSHRCERVRIDFMIIAVAEEKRGRIVFTNPRHRSTQAYQSPSCHFSNSLYQSEGFSHRCARHDRMKHSKILAIAAAFAICGCEKTIYPPGFVAARFSEVQTGWSIARVIETLGEPLRITAYSTDPLNHPLPGNQHYENILLKDAEKRGLDPHVFLDLE